ncbi:hypothetical protein KI387_014881 [Taxus chinensis]|uniref:UspA domain-containing protein n=1 Tax=Taxus chinensis TaxID=29808 RepID=A0AA38CR42_TAXCH|nr:hypothetical protein KI387_014881 [Taxus chinensis]
MRSPVLSRFQLGVTQISISSPGNEEIIQAGNTPPAEKMYVAVGKDLFESVYALKWALDNRLAASVILLHVHVPLRYIPSPMGNIPVNKARKDMLNAHKNDEQEKLNDCMKVYMEICSRVKVKAEPLVVEKAEVSRGIVEVVSELDIRRLIMGTTSAGSAISKKMKMQGPGKAVYVQKHAIRSCEVLIICKGKLVLVRKGLPLHNAQKRTSYKAPLNQSLWKPSSVQSDLLLNDPGFEASLDRKTAMGQVSSEFEEIHSQQTESDESCRDTSMEPEPCGNASWIRCSEGYEVRSLHKSVKRIRFYTQTVYLFRVSYRNNRILGIN